MSKFINLTKTDDNKSGYLARFQEKLENKPGVKKYTINDYRNLKKEIEKKASKDTGKLGFDAQNEHYQQKVYFNFEMSTTFC